MIAGKGCPRACARGQILKGLSGISPQRCRRNIPRGMPGRDRRMGSLCLSVCRHFERAHPSSSYRLGFLNQPGPLRRLLRERLLLDLLLREHRLDHQHQADRAPGAPASAPGEAEKAWARSLERAVRAAVSSSFQTPMSLAAYNKPAEDCAAVSGSP